MRKRKILAFSLALVMLLGLPLQASAVTIDLAQGDVTIGDQAAVQQVAENTYNNVTDQNGSYEIYSSKSEISNNVTIVSDVGPKSSENSGGGRYL